MSDQPNILFIITDQQRSETIQATGSDWRITPNLDRLAHSTYHNSGCKNNTGPMYKVGANDMIDFE